MSARHLLGIGATALAALSAGDVRAATIAVDATNDLIDDAGDCSLREAIIAANSNTAIDGCPAGDLGADTVTLPAGTFTLTITGADETWEPAGEGDPFQAVEQPDASVGDLDITESLTLEGAGSEATILQWAGKASDRILHVAPLPETTAEVTLRGLTAQNGTVGSTVINDEDPVEEQWIFRRFGGAIAIGAGAGVKLTGSSGPSGDEGGPTDEEEGAFGSADVTMEDVRILDSYAGGDAGGLFSSGALSLDHVWFEGNMTAGNGGALYQEGEFVATDVVFLDNEAEGGGAVFMTGPTTATMSRVLFQDNYATGGGGVSIRSLVDLAVTEAVVIGNEAFDVGGGFYSNGTMTIKGSTFVANLAGSDATFGGGALNSFGSGSFTLVNNIFDDNMAGAVAANCGCTGGTCETGDTFTSLGHNLEDADTCALGAAGDLPSTEPLLLDQGAYGGWFDTIAPSQNSPALEAGFADHCSATDARGLARPVDYDDDGTAACDIGAYELSPQEIDHDTDGFCEGVEIGGELFCADGSAPGDCDGFSNIRFPGNPEVCDGVDNDCNDEADDGLLFEDWWLDADGDGFGDVDAMASTCDGAPAGYVDDATDCDDASAGINPDAQEICNAGIDDDCNELADDADEDVDLSTGSTWYADGDGDGYGDAQVSMLACAEPEGFVADDTDCDDADGAVHPGAEEIFDNDVDDDCDGFADKEDTEYEGCGSSCASGPASATWLGLLGLLGLVVRRRR